MDEPTPTPYDTLRLALVCVLLFTIGRIHQYFTFLVPLRPALLTTGVAVAYAVAMPRSVVGFAAFRTSPSRTVLALAVFVAGSTLFGLSLGGSASFILSDYSKVLILWVLLVLAIRTARDLRLLMWGYLLGAGMLVYLSIFVYQLDTSPMSAVARLDDSMTYMYDPNDIGVILVSALPLAVLAVQTARWPGKLLALAIVVGTGIAIARSGSRGGFVGLIVVGLCFFVLLRQISIIKRVVTLVVVATTLALAAPRGYWEQMHTIVRPKEDYNWTAVNGRRQIAKRGIGYMLQYPVFGVGIANFGRAECRVSDLSHFSAPGTLICAAPHNSYLQAGAETGIGGLILWSSLIFGGTVGLLRLRRRLPRRWARADEQRRFILAASTFLPVSLIGFGVTSLFVSFAWLDPIYVLAAYTGGVYVSAKRLLQSEQGEATVVPTRPRSEWRSRRTVTGAAARDGAAWAG